jgi:dTDP-4-dehydrorhamnose 3,5-epimerase
MIETSKCQFQEIVISEKNYCRSTIPPMVWMGFQGLSDSCSILLNIANIANNPDEVDKKIWNKLNLIGRTKK